MGKQRQKKKIQNKCFLVEKAKLQSGPKESLQRYKIKVLYSISQIKRKRQAIQFQNRQVKAL